MLFSLPKEGDNVAVAQGNIHDGVAYRSGAKEISSWRFRRSIFDLYVATEANPMAGQCRCCAEADNPALHIHSDFRHLEFVIPMVSQMPIGEEGDVPTGRLSDRARSLIILISDR